MSPSSKSSKNLESVVDQESMAIRMISEPIHESKLLNLWRTNLTRLLLLGTLATYGAIRGILWLNHLFMPAISEYSEVIKSIKEKPELNEQSLIVLDEANGKLSRVLDLFQPYIRKAETIPHFVPKITVKDPILGVMLDLTDDLLVELCRSFVASSLGNKYSKVSILEKISKVQRPNKNSHLKSAEQLIHKYCVDVEKALESPGCSFKFYSIYYHTMVEDYERKVLNVVDFDRICSAKKRIITNMAAWERAISRSNKLLKVIVNNCSEILGRFWRKFMPSELYLENSFGLAIEKRGNRIHGLLKCCIYYTRLEKENSKTRPIDKVVISILEWFFSQSKNKKFTSNYAVEKLVRPLMDHIIGKQAIISRKTRIPLNDPFLQVRTRGFLYFFVRSMVDSDTDLTIVYSWAEFCLEQNNQVTVSGSGSVSTDLILVPRLLRLGQIQELQEKIGNNFHFPGAEWIIQGQRGVPISEVAREKLRNNKSDSSESESKLIYN